MCRSRSRAACGHRSQLRTGGLYSAEGPGGRLKSEVTLLRRLPGRSTSAAQPALPPAEQGRPCRGDASRRSEVAPVVQRPKAAPDGDRASAQMHDLGSRREENPAAARAQRRTEIHVLLVHEIALVEQPRIQCRLPADEQARAGHPVHVPLTRNEPADVPRASSAAPSGGGNTHALHELAPRRQHRAERHFRPAVVVHEPRPGGDGAVALSRSTRVSIARGGAIVSLFSSRTSAAIAFANRDVVRRAEADVRSSAISRTSGHRARTASALPSVDALSTTTIRPSVGRRRAESRETRLQVRSRVVVDDDDVETQRGRVIVAASSSASRIRGGRARPREQAHAARPAASELSRREVVRSEARRARRQSPRYRAERAPRRHRTPRAQPACRAARRARRAPALPSASSRSLRSPTETQTPAPTRTALEFVIVDILAPVRRRGRCRGAGERARIDWRFVRLSPTSVNRRRAGVRETRANASMSSGMCRRLKREPTKSTTGSRPAATVDALQADLAAPDECASRGTRR